MASQIQAADSIQFTNFDEKEISAIAHLECADPSFKLSEETKSIVCDLLNTHDESTVARILGHDVSNYQILIAAGRLLISRARKSAPLDIISYVKQMEHRINQPVMDFLLNHSKELQPILDSFDWVNYRYDFVSASTMIMMYLAKPKRNSEPLEMPTMCFMRMAVQFYHDVSVERVIQCFTEIALGLYTPASPTIFNSGFKNPQMSSCFVMSLGDNIESIYKGLYNAAVISKQKGGIGMCVSNIRHSEIGDIGMSKGIIPMLKVYDETINYVDQLGSRRGACSVYLRTHHIDIWDFVNTADNMGDHNDRLQYLDQVIWVSWLFMERASRNESWTLFCPAKTKFLNNVYGKEFERRYVEAEMDESITPRKVINARDLLNLIIKMQQRSGKPYIMHADSVNYKCNHKHIGAIRSSNLCVTPETKILTDQGHIEIGRLEGQTANVWNGLKFSEVLISKTSEKPRPVVTVHMTNGLSVTCTPNHLFLVDPNNDYGTNYSDMPRIMACDLTPGTELKTCAYPVINNNLEQITMNRSAHDDEKSQLFYTQGIVAAVGVFVEVTYGFLTYTKLEARIYAGKYSVKKGVLPKSIVEDIKDSELVVRTDDCSRSPPSVKETAIMRASWLAGVIDAIGLRDIENCTIIPSTDREWLLEILYMIQTLGCVASIEFDMDLPRENSSVSQFILKISSFDMTELKNICCLETHCYPHTNELEPGRSLNKVCVAAVVNEHQVSETYCFTEPETHAGVFGGIFTSQCLEITEYTDDDNINVCNLSSISLGAFVNRRYNTPPKTFTEVCARYDFRRLGKISRSVTSNLNKVIDHNYYPLDTEKDGVKTEGPIHTTNKRFRAIGIGVQGLADAMHMIDLCYDDPLMAKLDESIFACMYFNALLETIQLAIVHGKCDVFDGSPYSEGKLQFDLWREEWKLRFPNGGNPEVTSESEFDPMNPGEWGQTSTPLYDKYGDVVDYVRPEWDDIKRVLVKYGSYNSMLLSLMPTATSSRNMRNCESTEIHVRNIYSITVLGGNYPIVNRHMVADLEELNVWTKEVPNFIIANDGKTTGITNWLKSKMTIDGVVEARLRYIELKYRTMWEIPQKLVLRRAAKRGIYVDQSQSTNIYLEDATEERLQAVHMFTHYLGLKTGMYYLRQKSSVKPVMFTVDPNIAQYVKNYNDGVSDIEEEKVEKKVNTVNTEENSGEKKNIGEGEMVCYNEEGCLYCSA